MAWLSAVPAMASGPQLLVDAATGQVIAASGADASWHPASITKLMTAHLALKEIEAGRMTMDTPVFISAHAAAQPPSKLGLKPGSAIRLGDALRIMLVRSANDLAVAVGEAVGGTEGNFAIMMTAEARRLGMSATYYVNASGLHDERQVTTARDTAVLALAVFRSHASQADMFAAKSIRVGNRTFRNTNPMLGRYPGIYGSKTGFLCASGFNVVVTASRGGRKMLAVVMGEASARSRTAAANRLLDRGFADARDSGVPLSSYAIGAVSPAPDLRDYGCGRGWKGGREAAEVARLQKAAPMPSGKPEIAAPPLQAAGSVERGSGEQGEGDAAGPRERF